MTLNNPGQNLLPSLRVWWGSTQTRCERAMVSLLIAVSLVTIFSTALVQTLVVCLMIVVTSCTLFEYRGSWRRTPLDIPFFAFIAGRVLSIAFSQYPWRSISALRIEFLFYGVFFLATQAVRQEEEDASRVVMVGIVAAGVIGAIIGILKVVLEIEKRASSTTAGTYTLGAYLALVLPLAVFFSLESNRNLLKHWSWAVPLLFSIGILLTFDRLHWAAMGSILFVAALLSRKRMPFIVTAVALLALLTIPSVWGRFMQIFDLGENMNGRDVLWRGAAMIFTEHPITGFGPRSFPYIFPLFEQIPVRGVGSWHNDFLQVYMESGLLGLGPLLWLIVATYYHSVRWIRSGLGSPYRRGLVLTLLASVSVMFVIGGILDTIVGITFRILLAFLALLIARSDLPESPAGTGSPLPLSNVT
ncbi:MAG: O-antigen ligase family protein [Bacteroidota bacterium]